MFLLPSRSHFYTKSAEMEAIFNRCWVLEIQNAASANQSWASTNHIGRFGGLDVILQRRYGQVRGRTAKWKLAFTKFDCMKGETVLPLWRRCRQGES